MKIVVGLAVGLVLGMTIGFAVGFQKSNSQTKQAQIVAGLYLDSAKTVQETVAAQNRAFYLLAAMYECGTTSGIGGSRLLELSPYTGYMPASPLALKLFPLPTP
jgi:predicted transporter